MGNMTEEEAKQNLETTKKRDKLKDDYCNENCYLLLRIPYWEKQNIKKIVEEFVNENLVFNHRLL